MKYLGLVLLCAACGRLGFGAADPSNLDYGTSYVFVYNDVDPALTKFVEISPKMIGAASEFAISPNVETSTGLTFDPATGILSGNPDRSSPTTAYEITAFGDVFDATTTVLIRTAPGFQVNNEGDDGDTAPTDNDCSVGRGEVTGCTLRAAVEQLNAWDASPRLVVLPQTTIQLAGTEIEIANTLEIVGAGLGLTKLTANGLSRVFSAKGVTVRIAQLTLKQGLADEGGCLRVEGGAVTLTQVRVIECAARVGGGVMLSDNFGAVSIAIEIVDSVFEANTSTQGGGGLALGTALGPPAQITGSTFVENSTSTEGGGIRHSGGRLELEATVFSNNTGSGGGLMLDGSDAQIRNTTFSGNVGLVDSGGAILTSGPTTLALTSVTIASNVCPGCFLGAGIRQFASGSVTLENTILFGNRDDVTDEHANLNTSTATSLGHNLTDTAKVDAFYAATTGDLFGTDPLLGPLTDNGGPTLTRAITDQSPAFNAGGSSCQTTRDQRGIERPARGACDIGAFELE